MIKVRVSFLGQCMCLAALVACAALIPACSPKPKQALRLNLEPGRSYTLSFRTVANSITTYPDGTTKPLRGRIELRLALLAESTTPEGDTVLLVDPEKAAFPWLYNVINKPFEAASFRMNVSPTGHISGFTGTDEMRTSVRKALAATPPAEGSPFTNDMLLAVVSDEALTALLQPILGIWPSIPVTTGDEWTRDEIFDPIGDTLETTTFTLESTEGGVATLSMNSIISSAGKDKNKTVSGKSTGEVRAMTMDGTIRAYRSEQTLEGTMTDPATSTTSTFTSTSETQAELTAR